MGDLRRCHICGRTDWIECHHIFGGCNRKKSEKFGLTVDLCHWCHNEPPHGAHHSKETAIYLKKLGQKKFEEAHTRDQFIAEFGRNYLDD